MTLRYDLGEVITAMITPFDNERAVDYRVQCTGNRGYG